MARASPVQQYPLIPICHDCTQPPPSPRAGPKYVTLLVTRACNSRCVMCEYGRSSYTRDGDLTTGELIDIITELDELGTTDIILSGGEPLLRPDIFDIISEVAKRGIGASCALCTNGTLLDRTHARKLTQAGIKVRAVLSLDGSRPEIHDRIRGTPGSFYRIRSAVRLLVEEFGWGDHIGINTIITARNKDDVENIIRLAAELGARTIKIAPAFRGSGLPKEHLKPEDVAGLLARSDGITRLGRELGINTINLIPFVAATMPRCFMTHLLAIVDASGDVYPCTPAKGGFIENRGTSMGSLRRQSFAEIWNSVTYRVFREQSLGKAHPFCHAPHCGDVTANAMNYIRGPCKSCLTAMAEETHVYTLEA